MTDEYDTRIRVARKARSAPAEPIDKKPAPTPEPRFRVDARPAPSEPNKPPAPTPEPTTLPLPGESRKKPKT